MKWHKPLLERIMAYVDKTPTCWIWKASIDTPGYGQLRVNKKNKRVTRLMYEIHKGPIKPGFFICHSCDVRSCVNPDHLWQGTAKDNAIDALNKGRLVSCKGEANGASRINLEVVRQIREAHKPRVFGYGKVALKFGVSRALVAQIITNKIWANLLILVAVVGLIDPNCTVALVCQPGYTATVRPPASYTNKLKRQQMAALGLKGDPSQYEEDHYIPLELCGAPRDPANLWPELWEEARRKDVMETHLHKAVCAGQMTLPEAQATIRKSWKKRS